MFVIGSDISADLAEMRGVFQSEGFAANSSRTLPEFYQNFIRCFTSADQVVCFMSKQIDVVSERREPGKGSGVRGSTAISDDRYRFSARSVNLTLANSHKTFARPFADQLETKTEMKNLFEGLIILACDGLGDSSREDTEFFRFNARIFLEITPIDIQSTITVYKTVIIFSKAEGIL